MINWITIIATVLAAGSAAASEYKSIKIASRTGHYEVNMSEYQGARILVRSEKAPWVEAQDCHLAHVDLEQIRLIGRKTYLVQVRFEPELDDGRNSCTLTLSHPDGLDASVELFVNVLD
jgi:hypothetical protein